MALSVTQAIEQLGEHITKHRRYLLTTHVGPDGDGLGSALALSSVLRDRGAEAKVVIVDPLPEKYLFMLEGFPEGILASYPQEVSREDLATFDAIVLLDCGVWTRLGPLLDAVDLDRMATVCIDHHISHEEPAELTILDEKATATGTLVHRIFHQLGVPIGRPEAVALYVTLMTETGSFRFSNTGPDVHRTVAELLDLGIAPHEVFIHLYENRPHAALQITGRGLAGARVGGDGKLVYTVLAGEDFEQVGAVPEDADGLVNQILAVDGAEVAVLIYQKTPQDVKISFRAKNDVDVQVLAAAFGGGGHRKAAGATVQRPLAEVVSEVVERAEAAVQA